MRTLVLNAKQRRMLEHLAEGGSTQDLARKMNYSPGTVRVYLHNLYKVIRVKNRTQAVLWYLHSSRATQARDELPAAPVQADETFGDTAVREGLLAALGVMESFLGPYGRVWEVGVRLKGTAIDQKTATRVQQARGLWRALIAGTFWYGKKAYDEDQGERLLSEAPSEVVLLTSLLLIGGYSYAGDRLIAQLVRRGKGVERVTSREVTLLRSIRGSLYESKDVALSSLYKLAAMQTSNSVLKHIAMAALFHVYKAAKDLDRARGTANSIWYEAEAARRSLEAMGVRPLSREATVPAPKVASGQSRRVRETAAAA